MSLDLGQFLGVFFEESFEGLDAMESALVEAAGPIVDSDVVNALFRAAHSMKGGSATFGFTDLTRFTHRMETLLDEVRRGTRTLDDTTVAVLLKGVDGARTLLNILRTGGQPGPDILAAADAALDALAAPRDGGGQRDRAAPPRPPAPARHEAPAPPAPLDPTPAYPPSSTAPQGWRLRFRPHREMLSRGNDVLLIFRELASLGPLRVQADLRDLPTLAELQTTDCHLAWSLELDADPGEGALREVFDWVASECDLELEPLPAPAGGASAPLPPTPSLPGGGGEKALTLGDTASLPPSHGEDGGDKAVASGEAAPPSPSLGAGGREQTVERGETAPSPPPRRDGLIERASPLPAATTAMPAAANTGPASAPAPTQALAPTQAQSHTPAPAQTPAQAADLARGSSIRVSTEKIDALVDLVGELVITQSMLQRLSVYCAGAAGESLRQGMVQLERNTRELQGQVLGIRMLPIGFVFNRFPRLVHDLARTLGKQVEFQLGGEQTELDKRLIELVVDPLTHLLRNAMDHGLETPEIRLARGKPETGTLRLSASHRAGSIFIEVADDGAGIDTAAVMARARELGLAGSADNLDTEHLLRILCYPGLSTRDSVTALSGRGVGLDVVESNIRALGGRLELATVPGAGTRFTIRIPLTLAILDGQLIRVGPEVYILPLVSIVETVRLDPGRLRVLPGGLEIYCLRDRRLPVARLGALLGVTPDGDEGARPLLVIVEVDDGDIALLVDELLGQQQIVIKGLEANFRKVPGVSAATVLGDGRVGLILDGTELKRLAGVRLRTLEGSAGAPPAPQVPEARATEPRGSDAHHA